MTEPDKSIRFFVKYRPAGKRRYWFVSSAPGESGTRLRIHASPHTGDPETVLKKYRDENPGFEFVAIVIK